MTWFAYPQVALSLTCHESRMVCKLVAAGESPIGGSLGGPKAFPLDLVRLDSERPIEPLEDFVIRCQGWHAEQWQEPWMRQRDKLVMMGLLELEPCTTTQLRKLRTEM